LNDLFTVWQRSTVAELGWTSPSGPSGIPVVPLVLRDTPCVALPYAHADVALRLHRQHVAYSVTDQDAGGRTAVVGAGTVEVVEDLEGHEFVEHLLEQEVVKHPPSRLRADSLMARRENWWWVPRVLVRLDTIEEEYTLHPRTRAEDALLVRERAGRPVIDVVTVDDRPDRSTGATGATDLWARDGGLLEGADEPAFVFSHQYSPDFERWERWFRSGHLSGESLLVEEADGAPTGKSPSGPLSPYGLWERFTHHRSLARTCREGIAEAQTRGPLG